MSCTQVFFCISFFDVSGDVKNDIRVCINSCWHNLAIKIVILVIIVSENTCTCPTFAEHDWVQAGFWQSSVPVSFPFPST